MDAGESRPVVIPNLREALDNEDSAIRIRAIHIVAWQGDTGSLSKLEALRDDGGPDSELAKWAIQKIETLHPIPAPATNAIDR